MKTLNNKLIEMKTLNQKTVQLKFEEMLICYINTQIKVRLWEKIEVFENL